jgi:quinol monooxygenase YgiN
MARRLAHESVTREAGLRRYEYFRREEPDHVLALMAFDDYQGFIAHQASEHHHVLAGAMRDMIVEIRLERIDPIRGCSVLAPGESGAVSEGGPDLSPPADAELAARHEHYQHRYPQAAMSWWPDAGSHAD